MISLILAAAISNPPSHAATASHSAPARQAPAPRQAPRPAPPQHGFSLPRDVRPASPAQTTTPVRRVPPALPRYQTRPPAHGRTLGNPRSYSGPWGWNGGVAWIAAPIYWGGGFWGAYSLGLDNSDYIAEPDTPGAQLLENYQLTQTPCGPPNLVEIFGPDDSEICAFPNDIVAAGQYSIDPTTLTLVSYAQ